MDWKIFGLLLLLFSGVGALISNIAALFGYGGEFTLVLLPVCVMIAIVTGSAICRQLNRPGAPPPPYSELSPQYANYRRQRREGRVRGKWLFLCGFIGLLMSFPALWLCEWMGWPKQICLAVVFVATLGGIQWRALSLAIGWLKEI
jgi:dolichol kinase